LTFARQTDRILGTVRNVYVHNPQLRWMPVDDDRYNVAVAIEKPSDDVDPGQIRQIDPDLGGTSKAAKNFRISPRTSA